MRSGGYSHQSVLKMRISSRPHLSIVDLHAGFFLAGMATTLLGPLLPILARRWDIADAAAGSAFAMQFVASTAVSTISAVLVVRYGARPTLSAGFVLIALGVAALSGHAMAVEPRGDHAVYGCGLGLVLPTTNFLVAAANPGRESSAVSLVNVSWSAGRSDLARPRDVARHDDECHGAHAAPVGTDARARGPAAPRRPPADAAGQRS